MRTADGFEVTHGLRVWDNNLERGSVDLEVRPPFSETNQNNGHVEWWFYIQRDKGGRDLTSESRVATRHPFTGEKA